MVFENGVLLFAAGTATLLLALLGPGVYYLLVLRAELRRLGKRSVAQAAELESAKQQWSAEAVALGARWQEAERARNAPVEWSPEPESLQLNRRAQILGLHRQGKRAPEIASALHLPQGEVELMVKIQDLARSASQEIGSLALI